MTAETVGVVAAIAAAVVAVAALIYTARLRRKALAEFETALMDHMQAPIIRTGYYDGHLRSKSARSAWLKLDALESELRTIQFADPVWVDKVNSAAQLHEDELQAMRGTICRWDQVVRGAVADGLLPADHLYGNPDVGGHAGG